MAAVRLVSVAQAGVTLDSRSDDELMLLAQGGSHAAFSVLVKRHGSRLIQTCSRFVENPEAGGELAQEAWVAAWEHREQYRQGGNLLLWLITVARNRWRNQVRGRKVRAHHQQSVLQIEELSDAGQIDRLLESERRLRVRQALAKLPPPMREALVLRYGEELRYDEIARVLGDNESTLRSRVHHGLKSLKSELEKKR